MSDTSALASSLEVVILAAGEGTRMRSTLPKVLQPIGGRPMLTHVIDAVNELQPARIHVVIGHGAQQVREATAHVDGLNYITQDQQRGTGHAVAQAVPDVNPEARVLVLNGDHPLISSEDLLSVLPAAKGDGPDHDLILLTMELDDASGYGRIVRDEAGQVQGIVEHRDATAGQRAITEANTGVLSAPARLLAQWLTQLDHNNAQGEVYLTDVIALAVADGHPVQPVVATAPERMAGANDKWQLAQLEAQYQRGQAQALCQAGAIVAAPGEIAVRGKVHLDGECRIDRQVVLEGEITLGADCHIGPFTVLRNCHLAPGTRVHSHCHLEGVTTTGACQIGPFARLRPGTELARDCKVGNFVETKNARLGAGSKSSHLTYLGDVRIGEQVNIGAGTITCNYDGVNKHETLIEDGAFIGSDSQLVAPVTVGAGATLGAGTTLSKNAPPGQLTVSRARQTTVPGWQRPTSKAAPKQDDKE